MKTKKRSKIVSLLLALSMLVGMLPLSVIPAMAAGGSDGTETIDLSAIPASAADGTATTDPPVIKSRWQYKENPTWIQVNNSGGNRNGIARLKALMEDPGGGAAVYIKLTSDLVYTGDDSYNLTMEVVGCKHLDLNGHKLIYGVDASWGNYPFITVNGGSELHIYDSQNGGGYIHYEGKLTAYTISIPRTLIKVASDGALFVNGGKLEAGRSKEIYGTGWTGPNLDYYTGNITHYIAGHAVSSYGSCVINGGDFYGRGVDYSALYSLGSTIVNAGYFKGFTNADSVNAHSFSNLYINSGDFDTHKNDRILYENSSDEYEPEGFVYGEYGKAFGLHHPTPNPLADVVISGSGGKQRQTAKVTPQADSFSLEYPGWDTFNPASAAPRYAYINADSFTPYYKGQEHWLNQDYNPSTKYYIEANWQIFDKNGNPVSENRRFVSNKGFDDLPKFVYMNNLRAPDGSSPLDLEYGESYTIRCTLKEAWIGYGSQKHILESSAEHKFTVSEIDPAYLDFGLTDVRQVMGKSDFTLEVKGENQSDPAYTDALNNPSFTFGYEESDGTFIPMAAIPAADADKWTTLEYAMPSGKLTIVGCLGGRDDRGVYHTVYDKWGVFVMPRIESAYLNFENFVPSPTNILNPSPNGQGKYPSLQLRAITQDKLEAAGLTPADVLWERLNEYNGKWEVVTMATEGLSPEPYTGYLVMTDSRSGSYRASVEYDGQRWYSPVLTVNGRDYTTGQQMTVTVDSPLMEVNKDYSAVFTYAPDPNSGTFGVRWYPGVIVYKDNVPKAFYDAMYAWSYNEILPDGGILVRLNGNGSGTYPQDFKLFASTAISFNKEAMVPGSYTLIPCVKVELATGIYAPELVKADPITLKVDKRITAVDISVDGVNATNGTGTSKDTAPTYTMSETANKVRLSYISTPEGASYRSGTITWTSSDTSIATVTNGNLTALKPGTVTITMNYKATIDTKKGEEELNFTRYLKVTIPIAEVKFSAPDWSKYIGRKYSDVRLNNVYVRSYNGEWQSGGNYLKSRIYQMSLFEGASSVYPDETQVKYNDNYYMRFELQPMSGYQFPLKTTYVSRDGTEFVYETNEYTLKATGMDSDAIDTAFNLGYWPIGEWDTATLQTPDACKLVIPYNLKTIRDPSTVYVDLVAIETAEPREGDLRYAGDLPENDEDMQKAVDRYPNTMDVRVLTLSGETTQDGSSLLSGYSRNHKISTLQGSGTPYTPLDKNELTSDGDAMEFYQTFFVDEGWEYDREKLETTRYEAGTYAHELEIYLANQSAAGTKYYFSPDVRVLVNGHEVQLIDGYGDPGYRGNSLKLGYYFVSDPRPSLINGTIKGLNAPVTGALAQTADELTVAGTDSAGVASDKMYVSGLIWFIDANENGVLDEGERCTPENGFTQDGRFMGGKKYSAFVTLSVEAEDGRINNTAFTLKLDGIDTPLSTSQAQGVYTFPETEIVGYGVSGNVESFNSGTDQVTIQLIEQGQSEPAYETIVSGGTQSGNKFTASYSFSDVPSGTYTMKVIKSKHVTREYTITVGSSNVTQDVKIHLKGDVNGDGKITMLDCTRTNSHARGISLLTGYELQCADVMGTDGRVTMTDAIRINAHARGTAKLW